MNEFVLYEQLCTLENIAKQYSLGQEAASRIRETADRIVSQLYRVAVIGEFKKGKSSLINAIIGAEVLPTDILPMTAAITRVTYGTERKILIRYKDGREEERTVEELQDFATKLDEQKERRAETIREIEVSYPSVFCKNHIDIIDTPGLNDNEAMQEVTLGVLGEVDAAVFVISAKAPISLTERELIMRLIRQKGIRHIVFAVTHLDAVSSRRKEQDKILDFIRIRISQDILEDAKEQFSKNPERLEKAERILKAPHIFGVSSVLAMEGFIQDNLDLLEESRFPTFKKELLGILTAAQTSDVQARALDVAEETRAALSDWYFSEQRTLLQENEVFTEKEKACREYREKGLKILTGMLEKMDQSLIPFGIGNSGFEAEAEIRLKKRMIHQLGQIREDCHTDARIRDAIRAGAAEAQADMERFGEGLMTRVNMEIAAVGEMVEQDRKKAGYEKPMIFREDVWKLQNSISFSWASPVMPGEEDLRWVDVMPHISRVIHDSVTAYIKLFTGYIASWRLVMFRQIKEDMKNEEPMKQILAEEERVTVKLHMLMENYDVHQRKVDLCMEKLREER